MSMYDRWRHDAEAKGAGMIITLKKHAYARVIKLTIEMHPRAVIKNHKGWIIYDGRRSSRCG